MTGSSEIFLVLIACHSDTKKSKKQPRKPRKARRERPRTAAHALSPLCCCAALRAATSLRASCGRARPFTLSAVGSQMRSPAGRAQGCWLEAAAGEGRKCVLRGSLSSHSCFSCLSEYQDKPDLPCELKGAHLANTAQQVANQACRGVICATRPWEANTRAVAKANPDRPRYTKWGRPDCRRW